MKKGRVLVIDDEYKIRSLLELYLRENDYEVIVASNGSEGLLAIEMHRPDIVVLDIVLPDQSGLEVCQAMRRKTEIPVIFLSCLQESETIITGLEFGGDDYLTKPFDPNILVAKVNALLRRTSDGRIKDQQKEGRLCDPLTAQEIQILQWIEKGYTNKEIAQMLALKEGTIKVYNHVIFQKLHVKNRTQAIVRAKEESII